MTLFALSINSIASVIPKDVLFTLFVDDLSLSFASSRMAVAERKMQLVINKIVEWAERRGFKFSASKTVAVHFCHIIGVCILTLIFIYMVKEYHVKKKPAF